MGLSDHLVQRLSRALLHPDMVGKSVSKRDERERILLGYVQNFLDHLEDDYGDDDDKMLNVVIGAEMKYKADDGDDATTPAYWCSNPSAIWQRGFFECLVDLKRGGPGDTDPDS